MASATSSAFADHKLPHTFANHHCEELAVVAIVHLDADDREPSVSKAFSMTPSLRPRLPKARAAWRRIISHRE
jgi:hypothetical protein